MTGAEIRKKRKALGFSMREIAKCAHTSESTVHALETGKRKVDPAARQRILAVLENPPLRKCPAHLSPGAEDAAKLRAMLREEKQRRGLICEEVANICGLAYGTVSQLHSGAVTGSYATWRKICDALELDDSLLPDREPQRPVFQPDDRPRPIIRHKFTPGAAYVFRVRNSGDASEVMHIPGLKRLEFLHDTPGPGGTVHHVFRHTGTGCVETFTDVACADWHIQEVEKCEASRGE